MDTISRAYGGLYLESLTLAHFRLREFGLVKGRTSEFFEQFLQNLPVIEIRLNVSNEDSLVNQLLVDPFNQCLYQLLHKWLLLKCEPGNVKSTENYLLVPCKDDLHCGIAWSV